MIGLQLFFVDVHHLVVMREQKHLLAALQQRAHERRHIRRLGAAGGLPLLLRNLILDQCALGLAAFVQQRQLLHGALDHLAIERVVPVDLLHKAALGRQLREHLRLRPAQHQPLRAQIFAQQLRLGHDVVVIAVAPLAREALPVAQKVEIEDVDDIPDLAAVVVDRRAGQADNVLAGGGEQAGRRVFLRAGAAQLLHFIEYHRAPAPVGQHALPAAQQQIMDDVNVGLGQPVRRQPADDVNAHAALHYEEALRLARPVAHQMRRHDQKRRKSRRRRQIGQRLNGLAQTHFVGQQRAVRAQQERQPLLLEGHQLGGKGALRRLG